MWKVSVSHSKTSTEAELEVIRNRNKWDLELYDFARELNSAAIRYGGSSLRREVAVFKAYNRIPNKIVLEPNG